MWSTIAGIVQLLYLIIKNKFEKDSELKADKEKIHADWKEAIKSGDTVRISDMLVKLRTINN